MAMDVSWAGLAGASVMETAQFADVSRGTVSKVLLTWKFEGKTSSKKGQL